MTSKYNSPFSIGKRQTIFIDPNDPRVRDIKYGITAARIGSEINILGPNGISQAGSFSYLKNSGSGSNNNIKPRDPSTPEAKPGDITNLDAEWNGTTLVITFDFDFSLEINKNVEGFVFYLTPDGYQKSIAIESKEVNKNGLSQTINFTYANQISTFNIFHGEFDLLEIAAFDIYGNTGNFATLDMTGIVYVPDLCTPIITATGILMGYKVEFTEVCEKPYEYVSIEEVVSNAATAPSTGYQQVYLDSIRPAIVLTPTTEPRWIKARYTDNAGKYGPYSNAVKVVPTGITADLTAPCQVTSVTGVGAPDGNDPSAIRGILTLTLVNPVCDSDFAGYVVKIVNSGITWYQQIPTTSTLNTLSVNNGILVGQAYTISVATYDLAGNVSAYTAAASAITVSDTRVNTSVVTNLSTSATDSIVTASWTAPNDPQVASYKVMVTSNADTNFATPLQTVFTDSTTTSFGGLSPSTTYRIRVITKYSNNGPLSTNNTTTTFTLNAVGAISDGIAPTTNPTVTVKSLFKAFALNWSEITNADDVTYEVYAKTTNSTGIVDPSNLVMEINGTFAVITSLKDGTAIAYPAETSPTSATDYYFAVRAKDSDGISTASVTPVGPFTASRTGQFDIATNAIYANHITAGQIDADKMITDLLFTNKTINVGETTSLNRIRLDANVIPQNTPGHSNPTSAIKSRIFIGAGTYNNTGTSFYADDLGRFSLKDKLKFDGANLQIDANGTFGGLVSAGPAGNDIRLGLDAGGTSTNLHGIYITATSDYIYNSGNFRLGAGKITYNGTLLDISAQVNITGASTVTGNLTISGVNSSLIVGNGTTNSVVIKNGASGLGGLVAFDGNGSGMTEILNTPISSGGTTPAGNSVDTWTDASGQAINFFTKGALIGGWLVTSTLIRDRANNVVLDSSNKFFQIRGTQSTTNYYVKVSTASNNTYSSTVNVFEAGTQNQKPGVYITYDGILNALGANLTGTLTVSDGNMKFGDNVNGTAKGIYLDPNNYWYDTGAFKVGSATRYVQWDNVGSNLNIKGDLLFDSNNFWKISDNTFKLGNILSGTATSVAFDLGNGTKDITFNNMPAADFNGWAGDPTVTIDDVSKKLVKGRRFIYNSLYTGSGGPGTVSNYDGVEGDYSTGSGTKKIKAGDIVFIQEA